MQYIKLKTDDLVVEFHNNWLGQETVIANGQIVSKKSSVWGVNHYFTTMENGHTMRYVLTTKVSANMEVLIDLRKNGKVIHENVVVGYGSKPKKPKNTAKKKGLAKLQEYDLDDAIAEFKKALDLDVEDPEIYFHMACACSVQENTADGFECLKKAVGYGLQQQEMILNHDMLAFLRMHIAFEDFLNSGFTEYNSDLVEKNNASQSFGLSSLDKEVQKPKDSKAEE